MAQDEVETLEAALNFISQYELSTTVDSNAVNVTSAFQHSHKLQKTHSLEIPEENDDIAPFDPDIHATEAFVGDFKVESELFDAPVSSRGETQELLSFSMHPSMGKTPFKTENVSTAASSTSQPRRRRVSKKEEITELRDTVAELSRQLDQLHASSAPNSPAAEEHVSSILSQPESLWQQVAARQLILRQKAEEVNAQLRNRVETRVRQTKNLKRMLSRRNDAEVKRL
ncbi:hypothetical protein P3T76_010496 [Phytophthora citrophthora]|uniref:Uncharacterized protein n=1 Tax=Phytophthora citrophthora TaxID=4793 RepID=A0AAD9GCE7_9STRA|nr:hypothetical protein P3T76_010496 [Phytophthora citrophthora]